MLSIFGGYMGQLKPLYKEIIKYEQAHNNGDFSADNPNILIEINGEPIKAYKARSEIDFITKKVALWSMLGILLFQIPFGLFADCIYKSHILKQCKYSDGGTSYIAFFVGGFINNLFDKFISAPIAVSIFKLIIEKTIE